MDALDLIINALLDHEKQLDAISHRLNTLVSRTARPTRPRKPPEAQRRVPLEPRVVEPSPRVFFRNWSEFAAACRRPTMVAFELAANHFTVYALLQQRVFTYVEDLPDTRVRISEDPDRLSLDKASLRTVDALHFLLRKRLRCGLSLAIESSHSRLNDNEYLLELHYTLEPEAVKIFLADALRVAPDKIVEGQITV